MKQLEISEADTQLVIKVAGSTVARIVPKDDPKAVHAMLMEVLAEAPEEKEPEPEAVEPKTTIEEAVRALDGEEMGAEDAVRTVVEAVGEVLNSPEAQTVKSFFEKTFPLTRAQRELKKRREQSG